MKSLKRIIMVLLFALPAAVSAQTIDYNRIILPDNAQNISIEERLVQLAWKNNPENELAQRNIEIAKSEIGQVRNSWLDHIHISGNFNEFVYNNIENGAGDILGSHFYPMYNVGVRFPLSAFFGGGHRIDAAKHDLENRRSELNSQKLKIRAATLKTYRTYKMYDEALRIQTEKTENALNTFSLIEDRFKNGEATLEEYNDAFNYYKNEQLNKVTVQKEFEVAKLDLEELIGVDLDLVLAE